MEGSVDYVVLPITIGLRSGTLRLDGGRFRYTFKRKSRVLFDAPVTEFHSFARAWWGAGFHLWHGSTRHRFVVYHPVIPTELGVGVVANVAESVHQLAQSRV